MSPSWATFLFEAANFLLLAALLGWLFFRPVRDALERRRAALETEEREAAEKRSEAERTLAEATARRRALETSLADLRERALREAEDERARLIAAAREQAQRERETFKAELVALRLDQAHAIALDAAAAAREIVVGLLERIDAPGLEDALLATVRRQITELAAGGPLGPLIVEAAAGLAPEALAALADAAKVSAAEVTQRFVPSLVAGLRVLTTRGLVDASAVGLAAQAERALVIELETEESEHG
ncbi:MAG TPA: ATP synthase F0 subunit B [Myxococcota bacterium]|nr:ATP synthase F0 subunit B [Myxococcota bacterium]